MFSGNVPEFSLTKSRYDLSTYYGRFLHFVSITDPSTLFYTNEEILNAKDVLDNYKKTGRMCGRDSDMWNYRKIVESAIHPTTKEIIFPLVRISAIAPVNIPIIFGMVTCPASNVPGTLMMHFINQSYNSACNYANRAGSSQSTTNIALAYGLGVSSACFFAYGLGVLTRTGPPILSR
jgi:hypothetical protein